MFLLKSLWVALVIILVLGLSTSVPNSVQLVHTAFAATRNISLVGSASSGWNLTIPGPTIAAFPGDTVNIQLTTADVQHQFVVDVNNDGVANCTSTDKCSPVYNSPTPYSFPVDFSPGTYTYFCSIHTYMKGTFNVVDFKVTSGPSSLSLVPGASQSSTITVSSFGGFSGTVSLSLPNTPMGISASFLTSKSLSVTPATPATASLNITADATTPSGSYTVPVLGSNATISHTVNIAVAVVTPDFTVMPDHSSLNIVLGSPGSAIITLTSQQGFTGDVTLTATVTPSGPTASLNPATLSLASGGSASSTLSLTTTAASPGTYNVNVTATKDSSLFHHTSLSLTLSPQSSPSPPSASIPAYVLIIAGVVIVAAVLIVAFAVLRRRPGK